VGQHDAVGFTVKNRRDLMC